MSDSFADLWASSAPTKSSQQQPQQKLGSAVQPRRPQYDAFSILSASQPSSRPVVNNQRNDRQSRQPQVTSRGGDAFSSLFASSLDGTAAGRNPDRANMTMAERAVLTQQAKVAQKSGASTQNAPVPASSSLWDGLDALARPTTASPRPTVTAQDDFGFNSVSNAKRVSSTTSPPKGAAIENDDWGLHELSSPTLSGSRSAPAPTKPVSTPAALWDLDEFGSSEPLTSHPRSQPPSRSLSGTPSDFDFGDRENGLLGEDSDTEDTFGIRGSRGSRPKHPEGDVLGDLGKPVSLSHSPSPNPFTSTGVPVRSLRTGASPPPHITGQLVEMGFSPVDARAALVNTMTENGFDMQAATELLLSQAGENGPAPSSSDPRERESPIVRDSNGDRDRSTRRRPPTRTDPHTQSTSQTHPKSQTQPQLDITAEKLLSQASEIGRGMFNKANALWKEGKERAVKMYEEKAAVTNATGGAAASDGRPRWMRDHDHVPNERQRPDQTNGRNADHVGFKDEGQGGEQRERDRRPPSGRPPQSQPEREQEVDLFGTDSPTTTYQSPFRRGKPKTTQASSSLSSLSPPVLSPQATMSTPSRSSASPQPPQPPRTFTTTIAISALSTSSSHKSAGTDAYKRGDFPEALAAYIRALSALPPEHILRVPILTNVALVRSKLGELRDTIKACEEAVVIVRQFVGGASGDGGSSKGVEGMSFAGTESDFDEKTPMEVGSGKVSVLMNDGGAPSNGNLPTSVDLAEGLSKAFRRRAQALEDLEKWDAARSTWEVLLGAEWAGAGVKEAIKGVGRCRRMVDGGGMSQSDPSTSKPNSIPAPRPRPKPKPTPKHSASPPPSAALTALRSTQDAQQTEDAARLACKDAVETRLAAWKSGKEGNIRALLTSLDDTILWPELGWRKVGMAEVVSKGQVKGAYVRAIARVHPDKLNAGNTTVEQRMVANGVFWTLNEAWNVFQQH